MIPELVHQLVPTNSIRLHVVQAGAQDAPLVILLHGFPDFWYGWRHQIPYLANAGLRVWAPDQRGYNLSEKPQGIAAYQLDELMNDVIGLIDAAGQQQAAVVGHDWGGVVAWWLAIHRPERLERVVILNSPHPAVLAKTWVDDPAQKQKSSYMGFFQIPWLPEILSRLHDWEMIVQSIQTSSRPGSFTDADFAMYRQAWSTGNAFSCMLDWYRASMQHPTPMPANPRVTVPTLLIWGTQDKFLDQEMAQPSVDMCDHGRLALVEQATHWVPEDTPDQVNELIANFLQETAQPPTSTPPK
jgi:epoxide hydrolase 4